MRKFAVSFTVPLTITKVVELEGNVMKKQIATKAFPEFVDDLVESGLYEYIDEDIALIEVDEIN